MPPPSDEVYARESREFLDDLESFLTAECEGRHGADPVGFEVAFGGRLDDGEGEPLASEQPLVLALGGKRRMQLHGRIDRINRLGPGEYEVVDYKTGRLLGRRLEGRVRGRHAPSARHLRRCRRPAAEADRRDGPRHAREIPVPGREGPRQAEVDSRAFQGKAHRGVGRFWRTSWARACSRRPTMRASARGASSRRRVIRMPSTRHPGRWRTPATPCSNPTGGCAAMREQRRTPADQPVRDRLVTEFDRNFLVEAGAGSGKTYSLAMRMAAGIEAGRYTVEHMAAVTFTRKAAAELRGRFQLALEERLHASPPADAARRLEAALSGIERLFCRHHPRVLRAPAPRAPRRRPHRARVRRAGRGGERPAAGAGVAQLRQCGAGRGHGAAAGTARCGDQGEGPRRCVRGRVRARGRRVRHGVGRRSRARTRAEGGGAVLEGARQAQAGRVPGRHEVQGPAALRRVRPPPAGRAAHQIDCPAGRPAHVLERQEPHEEMVGRTRGCTKANGERRSRSPMPSRRTSWSRSSPSGGRTSIVSPWPSSSTRATRSPGTAGARTS